MWERALGSARGDRTCRDRFSPSDMNMRPPLPCSANCGAPVSLLVDVRAVAASRRRISKRALAAGLDEQGIGYLHLRGLGTPAEGRQPRAAASRRTCSASTRRIWRANRRSANSSNSRTSSVPAPRVPALLRARPRTLPPAPGRGTRLRGARPEGREPVRAAVDLGYSAGATARTRPVSTSWTRIATPMVPTTKPNAMIAVTASTRSKPPRLCSKAIIEIAAPEIT